MMRNALELRRLHRTMKGHNVPLTDEQLEIVSPAVFAEQPHEDVSDSVLVKHFHKKNTDT
jgi:hypothetical protein